MMEQEIRDELQKIQAKWYTPTAKIAKDIHVDTSLVNRFINNKFQDGARASERLLRSLEAWINARR